jgi:voltage-gated potassium channel
LFETFHADFSMVPSRIVAQECIAILTTPLLTRFLDVVRQADEDWSARLATRLQDVCAGWVPEVWGVRLNAQDAAAAHRALMDGRAICVGDLLRDNADREAPLAVAPLMVERDEETILLPEADLILVAGDHLLLAGAHEDRSRLGLTLQNANALEYVLTGREKAGGWLWQRFLSAAASEASR